MAAAKKIFYSMSEVCELLGLPASTVRFWEGEFKEVKPKRNAKGNRLFSGDDIETLKLIQSLIKERKMTIAGAKEVLANRKTGAKREMSLRESLMKIRVQLVQLMQDIDASDEERSRTIKVEMEQSKVEEDERYTQNSLFGDEDF